MFKLFLTVLFVSFLSSCATRQITSYVPICFASKDEAQKVAELIFANGFTRNVGYEVTGQPIGLTGLGLMYAGFAPDKYCKDGQYPVLISYEQYHSQLDPQEVLFKAKIVFNKMQHDIIK